MLKLKNAKGFTLIELIVSISIISLIGISIYSVLNISVKSNFKNEQDINSLQIAQSEMESLRNQIKDGLTVFETEDKDGNEVNLNVNNKTTYKKGLGNKVYDIDVDITKDIESNLYKVIIETKLENTTVNKKKTKIVTEIFGG